MSIQLDIIKTILDVRDGISKRQEYLFFRKSLLNNTNGFQKLAFDTRHVNSETEFISRRGLQNYNRSESFISEATVAKLKVFKKLKGILDDIHQDYQKDPQWQDSYCRILKNTLDKCLRVNIDDNEYSSNQPAVGNLEYITQLLHVRYRLTMDDIKEKSESEIKTIILKKDEDLMRSEPEKITKHDVTVSSYSDLLEKLFGGVKANKENPNVERTVTITIKDRLVEDGK
jgi:hypothetical protein